MTILLHELVGQDDRRFSPYCWRTRMALAHKGLEYETSPVSFSDISGLCGGAHKTVPIIEDGDTIVCDSFDIALYLERTYPDKPSLFGGPAGRPRAGSLNPGPTPRWFPSSREAASRTFTTSSRTRTRPISARAARSASAAGWKTSRPSVSNVSRICISR